MLEELVESHGEIVHSFSTYESHMGFSLRRARWERKVQIDYLGRG